MSSEFGVEDLVNMRTEPIPSGKEVFAYIAKIVELSNHEAGRPKSYVFTYREDCGTAVTFFFQTDEQECVRLHSIVTGPGL